jgi:hypothetical protein
MDRGRDRRREEREAGSGPFLRATSRGALVLETEHARRMMNKLRGLKDDIGESVEGPPAPPKPASAGQ